MPNEPIAHLVWLQGRLAPDDVEDYYEVARPGDKSVDGSDPFPVYASPSDAERHERAIPDGWKLVPNEPNPNMLGAWYRYKSGVRFPDELPATDTSDYGAYRAMLAAAPPPPAAVQEPVAVRALVWSEWKSGQRGWQANTIMGQYQVCYLGEHEEWQLYCPGKSSVWSECFSRHQSSDTAKAAAQADYEQRIRSALSTSQSDPAPEAKVSGVREAIEAAAKIAEEDRTPGYGPHKDAMEWLAETQRTSIAERIRSLSATATEGE